MPNKTDMAPARWEHFPHAADVGIRGYGKTSAEAFEQAACALTGIVTDAPIAEKGSVEVRCDAPDVEVLLVEWLNAIIYEMAVRNMIFGRFKVTISDTRLRGTLWGESVDQDKACPRLRAQRRNLYGAPRCPRGRRHLVGGVHHRRLGGRRGHGSSAFHPC